MAVPSLAAVYRTFSSILPNRSRKKEYARTYGTIIPSASVSQTNMITSNVVVTGLVGPSRSRQAGTLALLTSYIRRLRLERMSRNAMMQRARPDDDDARAVLPTSYSFRNGSLERRAQCDLPLPPLQPGWVHSASAHLTHMPAGEEERREMGGMAKWGEGEAEVWRAAPSSLPTSPFPSPWKYFTRRSPPFPVLCLCLPEKGGRRERGKRAFIARYRGFIAFSPGFFQKFCWKRKISNGRGRRR